MGDNVERNIAKRNQRFKDLDEVIAAVKIAGYVQNKQKVDNYIAEIYALNYSEDPSTVPWPPKLEAKDLIAK